MVLAHVRMPHAAWVKEATMASVLFFASTGMNLFGIVQRRQGDELRLAANALFLIFGGFAANYVQGTLWMSDVFQSAGMAMLAMLALRALLPLSWTWLFPLPFLIHFANQHLHWKVAAEGLSSFFLTPGLFPLLPWLSFYLLGAHLKRYGEKMALAVSATALALFGAAVLLQPFDFNKWWMSPDYFLLGCTFCGATFYSFRRYFAAPRTIGFAEVRRWGANSLVFYILHLFVIRVLEMFLPQGFGFFALTVAVTAVLLRPALRLQQWARGQNPMAILAAGAALSAAVVFAEQMALGGYVAATLARFALTFAFIACYPAFKNLSAKLKPASKHEAAQPAARVEAEAIAGD
jgi:hypothetical protein